MRAYWLEEILYTMPFTRKKIALIGGGNIGGTLAHLICQKNLGDIVIVDAQGDMAHGKALDISESCSVDGIDVNIVGGSDYSSIQDADVAIVTAGIARKPGMSRDDLLTVSARIIRDVGVNIKKYCPNAFVIVVTNPLDVMVWLMQRTSGLPFKKVVGMAGILDSSRFSYFLANALNISISDIKTFVLGGHGDGMVPLVRYTTVAGIPLPDIIKQGWISQKEVDDIIERTRNGGAEIVNLLKTGSAFYAPAAAAIAMAEAYLFDKRKIFPCAAWLENAYGVKDIYAGVPVVLGANGVEKIIELDLTETEKKLFKQSVESVEGLIKVLQSLDI